MEKQAVAARSRIVRENSAEKPRFGRRLSGGKNIFFGTGVDERGPESGFGKNTESKRLTG